MMRIKLGIITAALIAFSVSATAGSDKDAINKMQSACKLKQVTNACSVTMNEEVIKGYCVDAKEYGLICSPK